ncbi:MAG: hypothetical protein ACYDHE_11350 [Candidatus Acidiferrales bacterium]
MENATSAAEGVTTGISKGIGKTVGGATELIGEALHKVPGIGEMLAPRAGLNAERTGLESATKINNDNPGEATGNVLEEGAEWMGGDAMLKALGKLGLVAKNAPGLLQLAEKYPVVAKLLLGAAKGAVVGGTQAGVKAPAEGKDPLQSAEAGAAGGAVAGTAGAGLEAGTESKMARSLINRSAGATARDVTYGNPAKALLDENIKTPVTGDAEAYKDALHAGKPQAEAARAAGGRIAAVIGKINEYKPQLDNALASSKAKISVKDAILDPIYEATSEIINNRAVTETEKNVAIDKILELQKSLTEGLGKNISPELANEIKQQLGDRINWTGADAVGDNIKPIYKSLYGSLKQAVNEKVPEAADLNERMTNLLAAKKVLTGLSRKEEVGAGKGITSSNFWDVPQRLLDELGRVLPAVHAAAKSPITKAALGVAGEEAGKAVLPPRDAGSVRFKASDGSVHDVPTDQLDKAREIDPDLQVIEQ